MSGARRVLVTGGCGFLGEHLTEALVARGDEVVVFDGRAPARPVEGVRYEVGDIRDQEAVAAVLDKDVDVVHHLAAVVGVDQYLGRPFDVIDVNLFGTRHVLDRARQTGSKVVLASTSEVFGRNPAVPWDEDADRVLGNTRVDRWTYSSSKALAEHLLFALVAEGDLRATVVRYFNVYGPGQRPAFVVSRSIHRALNGRPPVVYDGGTQTRCFTYVSDAIDASVEVGLRPEADGLAFNVGSDVESRVSDVITMVGELTGSGTETKPAAPAEDANYQDLQRRVPDTTRIQQLLGWRCRVPLREGLERTIAWARSEPEWLALDDSGRG